MRYWSTLPHTTFAQTTEWVTKMVDSDMNGVCEFVISLRAPAEGTSVGPGDSKRLVDGMESISTRPWEGRSRISISRSSENGVDATAVSAVSEVIGKIGIWQGTEIGFLLDDRYWREGLMREAMEAVLPYYFGEVHEGKDGQGGRELEVVTADVDPRNGASLEFLMGMGFVITGRQERTLWVGQYGGGYQRGARRGEGVGEGEDGEGRGGEGEWVDSVYLELKRDVWMTRKRERERDRKVEKGGGHEIEGQMSGQCK